MVEQAWNIRGLLHVMVDAGILRFGTRVGVVPSGYRNEQCVRTWRLDGPHAPGEFISGNVRQPDIEQHHLRLAPADDIHRAQAAMRRHHAELLQFEQVFQDQCRVHVIFDNQDQAAAVVRALSDGVIGCVLSRFFQRQKHFERRAAAGSCAGSENTAAMLLQQTARQGQAYAEAGVAVGAADIFLLKEIEQFRQHLGRDAAAVVLDEDARRVVRQDADFD